MSYGQTFRMLVTESKPLPIVGAINAYAGMLAKQVGFKALYLSGAGVANSSFGLPDLGMTNLTDVALDAARIIDACQLPLLVDIDTGWGHAFNIARTIKTLERVGVASVHIEDQINAKRCGHRPGKAIVSMNEMGDRIKAAVDARIDSNFVIMARTDALASEGMNAAIDRACYYKSLGADMIFPEAMQSLEQYMNFRKALNVPILANITEFGKTPLFNQQELSNHGVDMVLYPLSAFRAMSKAALNVYETIMHTGSQENAIHTMQTREELYQVLNYHAFEQQLDKFMEKTDE